MDISGMSDSDWAHAPPRGHTGRTNIVIRATRKIARGTEIRMDYNLGDATRPYHAQLMAKGATEEELADVRYRTTRWQPPDALIQQQAEAQARRAGHMTLT